MDRRALSVLMILGVVVACATPLPAVAEPVTHARVSYESGGAMIKGPGDSDWSYATLNTLILANDTLWADTGALLEFEMVGGSFLRMADRSKAEVASLPPSAVIRAWTGSFYVQRTARSTGEYRVQAPAATLVVDKDTHARIDIVENGATTVSVRWGRVTVQTQAGNPVAVTAGLRVYVDPGFLASAPEAFDTAAEDDFDAWSRERAEFLAVGPNVIPSSYRVSEEPLGVADLARYGSWVTVDKTPYWRPTTAVDYVPYRSGIWSYVPSYGHVWVGEQPFSYVTSHYGRWTYNNSYGWLWTYRDEWAPAWVAAVRSGPNFIWTPLDPFNRPSAVGGYPYGYGEYGYGGYGHGYDGFGYGYSPYGYGGYGYDRYRYGHGGYGYGQDDFSFAGYWDFGSFRFSIGASSYCPADRLFSGYGYPYPGNRYPYGGYGSLLGDFASLLGGYGSSYGGYGYPYGGLGESINIVGNDIEIWNIFGNTINADLPWIDGRYPLSSYTPTRVVRGPDQFREGGRIVRAVERIGRLEQSAGRAQFASVERSGGRLQQTALRAGVRSADVRRVEAGRALRSEGTSLSQRLPREARAIDMADRGAARATRSVVASDGNRSTGNDRGAVRTRDTRSGADASRTIASRSTRAPESVDARGRGVAARSGRDGVDTARTAREPRAITLDRSAAGGSERTPRARASEQAGTPARRAEAGRTARTPDRAGAEAALRDGDRQPRNIQLPGRSGGAESRVPSRNAGPEQSRTATRRTEAAPSPRPSRAEPDRTDNLRSTGSNRNESAGRSVATRTPTQERVRTITLDRNNNGSGRGQGPGASARVAERTPNAATAPSRTVAPRDPRSATRTAPQASARGNAERRTAAAPRVTVPPSRSAAPAPNTRTQVNREVQRPRATERSVQQAPRRQVQAPRASAPRQVESPRPAAPRQVVTQRNSAPERRSEAPRIQAPQRRSEAPRIQAPQRRSEAPRIQAPQQRSEAPRIQAPQRRVEAPRIQAPQQRSEAPRIQAPQRRSEAPEPRSRISTRDSRGGGDSGKRGNFEREGRGR